MAERNLGHLNYGHAGEAAFNLETRKWSFGRQFKAPTLKQIRVQHGVRTITTEVVPASTQFLSPAVSTRLTDANDNVKALLRHHPQLVPASDFLPELAVTSAAILSTTATYDPLVGSLFATGSVTLRQESTRSDNWENPRRVAATVTGEAGNILRLTLLYKETLGWGQDKSVYLRGETFRNTDHGYWNEDAAPIQQVCFAQSEDRSTLLAARLPTKTVIFRPVYSQHSRPSGQSSYYHFPPSYLNAHPIVTLNIDQSGGSPHADIAFNPDFQLQFAVVDQHQTWSVWDVERSRKSGRYSISCLVQGNIVPPDEADVVGEDGWARILWVGDVNTILVCDRRRLSIVGIRGNSFAYLPCPALFSSKSSDWFLDVKRDPWLQGRFLVLTSTSLFLMAVTTTSEALDRTVHEVGTRVLASWRHYRSAEDFTLSISAQMLDERDMCVLLHSRLNNLTQTYVFRNHSSDYELVSSTSATLLDPIIDGAGYIAHMTLEPLQFAGNTNSAALGLGRSYFAQGLRFYKLFTQRSDMSVHEAIMYSSHSANDGLDRQHSAVEGLDWSTSYRPRRYEHTIRDLEDADFLDDEDLDALEEPASKLALQAPNWIQSQDPTSAHPTTTHRALYDALIQNLPSDERTIDIPTVTRQLKQQLAYVSERSQLPPGTMVEFAGMQIDVSDIDEASSSLHDLLTTGGKDESTEVCRLASAHLLQLSGEGEQPTISSLYDSILQSWIAPLPSNVPLQVRQRKERLARRIAAEVILSTIHIRQRGEQAEVAETQPGPSQDSAISMPILSPQPLERSPEMTNPWPFSQPLPTVPLPQLSQPQPSLSQTSTSFFSQSQAAPVPSPSPSKSSALVDPLARLSKYLKFKDDATPSAPIPASVSQLLSHWQPGIDPRTYDWEAIERADRAENLDAPSQQQLEKERKRKERRERKQKREDELARSRPSSQPITFMKPTAFPRSSPGPMLGGIGSSSQITSETQILVPLPGSGLPSQGTSGAQSQVEPGRYGGRPEKKKKKKRVGGF